MLRKIKSPRAVLKWTTCISWLDDTIETRTCAHPHRTVCSRFATTPQKRGRVRILDATFLHAPVEDQLLLNESICKPTTNCTPAIRNTLGPGPRSNARTSPQYKAYSSWVTNSLNICSLYKIAFVQYLILTCIHWLYLCKLFYIINEKHCLEEHIFLKALFIN